MDDTFGKFKPDRYFHYIIHVSTCCGISDRNRKHSKLEHYSKYTPMQTIAAGLFTKEYHSQTTSQVKGHSKILT